MQLCGPEKAELEEKWPPPKIKNADGKKNGNSFTHKKRDYL